jgi:two-component system response regulator CpxR
LRTRLRTPILMLTARGDEVDRIVGLEMGADDYLSKPFNPRELLARMRAVLRRVSAAEPPGEPLEAAGEQLQVGDLRIDVGARQVLSAGQRVELTSVEFALLVILVRQAGQVVSREELIQSVLGRSLSPFDRSIDVHVSKVRKKLGRQIDGLERIRTIRGAGYLYARTPAQPA